jgi:hypothetical protein
MKRIATMASNRSKTRPAARKSRSVISFEMAVQLCPHSGIAEKVAENFGLLVPDYDGIREEHERTLRQMWHAFGDALNDKATQMHFQRIVGSLVSSAVGAGRFYSDKVIEARAANARAVDGGEEGGAPIGLESKAQRTREFAADMAMQAYALLAAAHGAVNAYKEITGDDWRAYEARTETATVEKRATTAQMGAFEG